jgi:hypothetical protein
MIQAWPHLKPETTGTLMIAHFLAAVLGLLCLNGAGALELATHAVVDPRHALRAETMCAAVHHAALGIEAALIALDGLPLEDLKRTAVLRDAAEVSLEALESEWQRTIAWIDSARKQLASANVRAAELTSWHVDATGASATLGLERFSPVASLTGRACVRACQRASAYLWGRMRLVKRGIPCRSMFAAYACILIVCVPALVAHHSKSRVFGRF